MATFPGLPFKSGIQKRFIHKSLSASTTARHGNSIEEERCRKTHSHVMMMTIRIAIPDILMTSELSITLRWVAKNLPSLSKIALICTDGEKSFEIILGY